MIDNQLNTYYSKQIKNYEIPLGGVWSLVRIQSPRLVNKKKELSGWLNSFLLSYTDGLLTVGVENKCYQT